MPNGRHGLTPSAVENRLLRSLPPADLKRLLPQLEPVELAHRQTLMEPDRDIAHVYFIEAGVVSLICVLEDGARIEVGMTGSEGFLGLPLLFGSRIPVREGMVQVQGRALRMAAAHFRAALVEVPALLPVLWQQVEMALLQATQSAACNARHPIQQRLARWLLTTHDRVAGDTFEMTQETMSTLLGVRRPAVTLAIGALQKAELVRHTKSQLQVVNRRGLEAVACECYGVVARRSQAVLKRQVSWAFDSEPPDPEAGPSLRISNH